MCVCTHEWIPVSVFGVSVSLSLSLSLSLCVCVCVCVCACVNTDYAVLPCDMNTNILREVVAVHTAHTQHFQLRG